MKHDNSALHLVFKVPRMLSERWRPMNGGQTSDFLPRARFVETSRTDSY